MGEHSAHAIRRGPDGWLYVLAGNMTGIDDSFDSDSRSPITRPIAGYVITFCPDFTKKEIVVDGLIFHTEPETTVRIESDQIETVSHSTISLMPQGLIKSLPDEQLQDLYAYLKSLR